MSIYEFDEIDRQLALALMQDATLTSQELGQRIGLSTSATNERVRRLKQSGVVIKIAAHVAADFLKLDLGAYVFVQYNNMNRTGFHEKIKHHPAILECHHLTGEYDYLLKVRCQNTHALESLITDFLKVECGVSQTLTQVILSSPKEDSCIVAKA